MKKTLLIILLLGFTVSSFGQNPILPPTAFIPDGEPHVFEYHGEKRLFLYGSRDEYVTQFCGKGHDGWSAPVSDLTKWTSHGEIFNIRQAFEKGYGDVPHQNLNAPDCVYNPLTKKYYLYTFLGFDYQKDGKKGPKMIVASSDSPAGPFIDPIVFYWPGLNTNCYDPSVLVMQDGNDSLRVYAYWGFTRCDTWARIDPHDMHTIIDGKTGKADPTFIYKVLNNPQLTQSTFFEASSIKQVAKDKFVFIYSPMDRAPALDYCYSNSPEGPWTYGGRLIDNGKTWQGGNDHGSIVQVNGQWYLCYHRRTCDVFNRQAMMEPIDLRIEGDKVIIPTVEMTSQGVVKEGLDAYQRYNIYRACYVRDLTKQGKAGTAVAPYIDGKQRRADGLNPMVNIRNHSIIGFKYFNFGSKEVSKLRLWLNMQVEHDLTISLYVAKEGAGNDDDKRVLVARTQYKAKPLKNGLSEFRSFTLPFNIIQSERLKAIGGFKGKLALFFVFEGKDGEELCQWKEFQLLKRK
jgi:arabinoxylan arabinofuranohydrolase